MEGSEAGPAGVVLPGSDFRSRRDRTHHLRSLVVNVVAAISATRSDLRRVGTASQQHQPLAPRAGLPGFAGQYRDNETGYTYLRNRYYDPGTTQFTTPNPLAVTGSGVYESTSYSYAAGNPVNLVTPNGTTISNSGSYPGLQEPRSLLPTPGSVWSGVSQSALSVLTKYRHNLVDVGAGLIGGSAIAICAASVACGSIALVSLVVAVFALDFFGHRATDAMANDPSGDFSVRQALLHAGVVTLAAATCSLTLGDGCLKVALTTQVDPLPVEVGGAIFTWVMTQAATWFVDQEEC